MLANDLVNQVSQKTHHIKLPNFDQSLPNISHSICTMITPPPPATRVFHSFLFFVFLLRNKQQHMSRARAAHSQK